MLETMALGKSGWHLLQYYALIALPRSISKIDCHLDPSTYEWQLLNTSSNGRTAGTARHRKTWINRAKSQLTKLTKPTRTVASSSSLGEGALKATKGTCAPSAIRKPSRKS